MGQGKQKVVHYVAAVGIDYEDGLRLEPGDPVPADKVEKWLVEQGLVVPA